MRHIARMTKLLCTVLVNVTLTVCYCVVMRLPARRLVLPIYPLGEVNTVALYRWMKSHLILVGYTSACGLALWLTVTLWSRSMLHVVYLASYYIYMHIM